MKTTNRSFTSLAVLSLVAGCGNSVQPFSDAWLDMDTSFDLGWDLPADGTPDGIPDTGLDTGADIDDPLPDTAVIDTIDDTAWDPLPDTAMDTWVDTATDTGIDTWVDTATDTGIDTWVDTVIDTGVDTATDTGVDTTPGRIVGEACTMDTQCTGVPAAGVFCMSSLFGYITFPGGYCSATCTTSSECGALGDCLPISDLGSYCLRRCTTGTDCRTAEGYTCDNLAGTTGTHCIPPISSTDP